VLPRAPQGGLVEGEGEGSGEVEVEEEGEEKGVLGKEEVGAGEGRTEVVQQLRPPPCWPAANGAAQGWGGSGWGASRMEGQEGRVTCAACHAQGAWKQQPGPGVECLLDEGHVCWHSLGWLRSLVVAKRRWTYPDLGPDGGNGTACHVYSCQAA
jgi:hypothetical protein